MATALESHHPQPPRSVVRVSLIARRRGWSGSESLAAINLWTSNDVRFSFFFVLSDFSLTTNPVRCSSVAAVVVVAAAAAAAAAVVVDCLSFHSTRRVPGSRPPVRLSSRAFEQTVNLGGPDDADAGLREGCLAVGRPASVLDAAVESPG
jgi:hypothetical protein